MRRHRRAAKEAQWETDNAITALEACRVQLVNAVAERDAARAKLQDVRAESDEVICLAETRETAVVEPPKKSGPHAPIDVSTDLR